jgi:hypothetical protein
MPDRCDRQHSRDGRKPKLSPYQRAEAIKRRAAGETLASIARSYGVDISMISRLSDEPKPAAKTPAAPKRPIRRELTQSKRADDVYAPDEPIKPGMFEIDG